MLARLQPHGLRDGNCNDIFFHSGNDHDAALVVAVAGEGHCGDEGKESAGDGEDAGGIHAVVVSQSMLLGRVFVWSRSRPAGKMDE